MHKTFLLYVTLTLCNIVKKSNVTFSEWYNDPIALKNCKISTTRSFLKEVNKYIYHVKKLVEWLGRNAGYEVLVGGTSDDRTDMGLLQWQSDYVR